MTAKLPLDRRRALRIAGALAGLAVVLGACTHTDQVVTTASVPDDYRLRHPIAIQEANRSIVIFVGHARGGLSASQRADVMGLAQIWLQEGNRRDHRRSCRSIRPMRGRPPMRSAKFRRCSHPPACRRAESWFTTIIPKIRASWQRSG